jgi:signal transduction histidine kinase
MAALPPAAGGVTLLRSSGEIEAVTGAVERRWRSLAPGIEALLSSRPPAEREELRRLLHSETAHSLQYRLSELERLTAQYSNQALRRVRRLSHSATVTIAVLIVGALSLLLSWRARHQGEENIRLLTQSLLKRIEDERKLLSYDVQEVVAQEIATAKMECQNLQHDLSLGQHPSEERMEGIIERLSSLMSVTGNLPGTLKPRRLDHFGLSGGIKALCNDISAHSEVTIHFLSVGLKAVRVAYDAEVNLYRVARELLRYIRSHSAGDLIDVKLIASSPYLYLRIFDYGGTTNPFQGRQLRRSSREDQLRLISIEERIRLVRGSLTVESINGRGIEYKVAVPLHSSDPVTALPKEEESAEGEE